MGARVRAVGSAGWNASRPPVQASATRHGCAHCPSADSPGHRGDQLAHLGAEARAADRPAGAPAPEEQPRLAMPADDALGPDQDQVPAPVTAESANHNPEEFVASAEPRSLPGRPCQHRELMTEQEILGGQCLAVAYGRTEKAEQKKEILEHRLNIMPLNARSRPGRLFAPLQERDSAPSGLLTEPKLSTRQASFHAVDRWLAPS
jgi:hypothetical protein